MDTNARARTHTHLAWKYLSMAFLCMDVESILLSGTAMSLCDFCHLEFARLNNEFFDTRDRM